MANNKLVTRETLKKVREEMDKKYLWDIVEYGIRWAVNSSNPVGKRVIRSTAGTVSTWNIDYTANDMNNGGIHYNPFDEISLFHPTTYTDTWGNKFSRFARFYVAQEVVGGYQYLWVCKRPARSIYRLPRAFKRVVNGNEQEYWNYVDIGQYEAGETTVSGTATICSKPGFHPSHNRTRTEEFNYAKVYNTKLGSTTDEYYQITTMSEITEILQPLMTIMFGTRNSQAVYNGYTGSSYTGGYAIAGRNGATIYCVDNVISDFRAGASVVVNNSSSSPNTAGFTNYFKINSVGSVEETADNTLFTGSVAGTTYYYIVLDGTPSITVTHIFTRPCKTGETDSIDATSGTLNNTAYQHSSGEGGMYSFKVFNIENIYGNIWKHVLDLTLSSYYPYIAKDIENWSDSSSPSETNYHKANYTVSSTSSQYVVTMKFDSNLPECVLPTVVSDSQGGSSTTYYADWFYVNSGVKTAFFGGALSGASLAGLWCWSLSTVVGITGWSRGARLSHRSL